MLFLNCINELKGGKNLLAFSAGVDSSALFFLLLDNKIKFDIAIVNYGIRNESIKEERYALSLADKYNLKIYRSNAPKFQKNFEKNARDFRYNFFKTIIKEHGYNNLITAHQLNDQLEWFLMRLVKGAGLSELLGLENLSNRDGYQLIRPILHHSKNELLDYLDKNGHRYFIDSSNSNPKYERNYFRKEFANKLITEYKNGIERSFQYLKEDRETLMGGYKELFSYKQLYILKIDNLSIKVQIIDRYLKKLGYLLSSAQRQEIKRNNSIVIGGLWAIELVDTIIFISPYLKRVIPKKYREIYRKIHIPPKIRGYCYSINITFKENINHLSDKKNL
jgi:tRNA(Ile)-lysidine synthase